MSHNQKIIAIIIIFYTIFFSSCATIDDNRRAQVISGAFLSVGAIITGTGIIITQNQANECYNDSFSSACEFNSPIIPIGSAISGASFWTLIGTSIRRNNLAINQLRIDANINPIERRDLIYPENQVCVRNSLASYTEFYTSLVACGFPDTIRIQCESIWLCQRNGVMLD
jgi:hypothetical protein